MLPSLKQRTMIALAVLVGGLCWWSMAPAVSPVDASSGLTLFDAHVGWIAAAALILLAGIPAIGSSTLAAALGNPLAGPFCLAAALMILAGNGGGSAGFLRRSDVPGDFLLLIVELVLWTALYVLLFFLIARTRRLLRRRLPALASVTHPAPAIRRTAFTGSTTLAAVLCAAIGGVLCHLLVRTPEMGQIFGSLVLAFGLAGFLAQIIVPRGHYLGVLAGPVLTALAGYLYGLADAPTHEALLRAWYTGEISGLVWVLPIHYASAAMVGVTLGAGAAQAILAGESDWTPAVSPLP